MNNYTKLQKYISYILIFTFLFNFIFDLSFLGLFQTIFAQDDKSYSIVSIYVEESIYDGVKNSTDTYAKNIQGVLENTKAIIIPIPGDTKPSNIAALSEKLYFEGYAGLDGLSGNSKLIGSVFIGDIAIPIAMNDGNFEKTILPYVDFLEKQYIYNPDEEVFIVNPKAYKTPKAEIWHGFISPNTGNSAEDVKQINDYFTKSDDYYKGMGKFINEKGIHNGKESEELIDKYRPQVFYYDQIRETKGLQTQGYDSYAAHYKDKSTQTSRTGVKTNIENLEDIMYDRYSADLAGVFSDVYQQDYYKTPEELQELLGPGFDAESLMAKGPETNNVSDIQLQNLINETKKEFLQSFNDGTLQDIRSFVHNAGRYNYDGDTVDGDTVSTLISDMDLVMSTLVKNVNNDLEGYIDDLVMNKGLARDIAVLENIRVKKQTTDENNFSIGGMSAVVDHYSQKEFGLLSDENYDIFMNYLHGTRGSNITKAEQCSIYRGAISTDPGGQLVESNRAYNINLIESDLEMCSRGGTALWGGNSPINININGTNIWNLGPSNYKDSVIPLYDAAGSKLVKNPEIVHDIRQKYCVGENNLVFASNGFSCNGGKTRLDKASGFRDFDYTFDETYENFPTFYQENMGLDSCQIHTLMLNDIELKRVYARYDGDYNNWVVCPRPPAEEGNIEDMPPYVIYNYNKIESSIEHKSGTLVELNSQIENMISPNLPIDRDRFIDFIAANNDYDKIYYPYLFRYDFTDPEFSVEKAKAFIKQELDKKSAMINEIIEKRNPNELEGVELEIYKLLKRQNYPTRLKVDLYQFLVDKGNQEIEILGDKKTLNYLDTLALSIMWLHETNESSRYKFIFENYLGDMFQGDNYNVFLPENKKQYEIAYIGSMGDPQNMYIKMDPRDKGEHPYSDIIADNLNMDSYLIDLNNNKTLNRDSSRTGAKCAPPDGVPLWEWLPAVMCWLEDMLPPKIEISEGNCGINTLDFYNEIMGQEPVQCLLCEMKDSSPASSQTYADQNKNGIPDVLEKDFSNGSMEIQSDSDRYPYSKSGNIEIVLKDDKGQVVNYDNLTNVEVKVIKAVAQKDESEPISPSNSKIIFDISDKNYNSEEDRNNISKYITLSDLKGKLNRGVFKQYFNSKTKDADITIEVKFILKSKMKDDPNEVNIFDTKTKTYNLKIRAGALYTTKYILQNIGGEIYMDVDTGMVEVSDSDNIFIADTRYFNSSSDAVSINALSNSNEKLIIAVGLNSNLDRDKTISYPINIKITNDKNQLILSKKIEDGTDITSLGSIKDAGTYKVEIIDAEGINVTTYIQTIASKSNKLETKLRTSLMETNGVITTNAFWIYDDYGNPALGDLYQVKATISGNSVVFDNGESYKDFGVYSGYSAFRLKSTSKTGNSTIKFELLSDGEIVDTKTETIKVVDTIEFEVELENDNLKVGGNSYNYTIKVMSDVENFNSRGYIIPDETYITPDQEYVDIVSGSGNGSFTTKTRATKNYDIKFIVDGARDPIYKEISITPDAGLKLGLTLTKSKFEASPNATSLLYVDLKDRYNNIVWDDNGTNIELEIDKNSKNIINTPSSAITKDGRATFEIRGTSMPGTAFFKAKVGLGELSKNSLILPGQAPFNKSELDSMPEIRENGLLTELGKKFISEYDNDNYIFKFKEDITFDYDDNFQSLSSETQDKIKNLFNTYNNISLEGLDENAGKLETYYFWNKEKIQGNNYNSIYTTLLGANYGDITIKDNLANSIIFDRDNKALAVTSILSDTRQYTKTLNINPDGSTILNKNSNDISEDITEDYTINKNGELLATFYNNTFDTLVAEVSYNLKGHKVIDDCESDSIYSCFDKDNTSIVLKLNSRLHDINKSEGNTRVINTDGRILFEVKSDGSLYINNDVSLVRNKAQKNGLIFDIKQGVDIIAQFGIRFIGSNVELIRDKDEIGGAKGSQGSRGGVVVYLEGREYFAMENYLGGSTHEGIGYTIAYNDPFKIKNTTQNVFGNHFEFGYENFETRNGLGWADDNKILLSFAAGKNIGDATKDFMSFGIINIGDPVVKLKDKKLKLPGTNQDRKYDSTIGYLVSKNDDNIDFVVFDYNNDKNDDIIILKNDGYIELLEGTGVFGEYNNRGNLIYISDYNTNTPILAGDFFGDGYDDIALLNEDNELVILNNTNKKFKRLDLELDIDGEINQMLAFDMDNDGKMDLVVSDNTGQIYVFYGTNKTGEFEKKIVDDNFGITLNESPRSDNGAIYYAGLYQIPPDGSYGGVMPTSHEELNKMIEENVTNFTRSEFTNEKLDPKSVDQFIYLQANYKPLRQRLLEEVDAPTGIENTNLEDQYGSTFTTFLKSEYGEYSALDIKKTYKKVESGKLKRGDKVILNINIRNTSTTKTIQDIAYLEYVEKIFDIDNKRDYKLNIGGRSIDKDNIILKRSPSSNYTFIIESYKENGVEKPIDLGPNQSLNLELILETKSFKYGHIEVGYFNENNPDSKIGDIIFKDKPESCGQAMTVYNGSVARTFSRNTKEPICEASSTKIENDIDIDEMLTLAAKADAGDPEAMKKLQKYSQDELDKLKGENKIKPDKDYINNLDKINENIDEMLDIMDKLLAGLNCGFGGGSCISSPLNWAPLAPGNDPTLFGMPIGDGLKIDEGIPIFSAMTGMWSGNSCIPSVWPISPLRAEGCGGTGAGGYLGINSPRNNVRIFVTPTLTGAIGTAICFGGPRSIAGRSNPPMFHPLVPGGNCVVMAKPLVGCKGDGSDGDASEIGNPNILANGGIVQRNCKPDNKEGVTPYLGDLGGQHVLYRDGGGKNPNFDADFIDLLQNPAKDGGIWRGSDGPLINIGGSGNSNLAISMDTSSSREGNFEDIVKLEMDRIDPFPDFVMDWVTRQLEEVVVKLTDLPTLFITLPDFTGVFDHDFGDLTDKLKESQKDIQDESREKLEEINNQIAEAEGELASIDKEKNPDRYIAIMGKISQLNASKVFEGNKTISGIKGVYEFLGNLPIISIRPEKVNINLPWIDKASLDKAIIEYEKTKIQWEEEMARAKSTIGDTSNFSVDYSAALSDLNQNIEILKSYKKIPEDVYKMLKIKDVWLEQILCNIEILAEITGAWIGRNGETFKTWVELYILGKAILKSWQVIVDIFINYDRECHDCKNERDDLLHYEFKIIDAVIPKIPIIKFPKWPDIHLDLHNIRVDINIDIPEYEFNFRPITLPTLPNLELPSMPGVGINLPNIPLLPEFTLPEFPDLPSMPAVKLPDLPPRPKIPKLFASIEGFLDILKLITKAMCILKSSPFVPEWRAGDQIAFITERQGFIGTDFLDLTFPQFSFPFVDAIRVSTYVNLEQDHEFLVELARQMAMPINLFENDIANMVDVGISDINLSDTVPSNIDIDIKDDGSVSGEIGYTGDNSLIAMAYTISKSIVSLHKDIKKGVVEIDSREFKDRIIRELAKVKDEKFYDIWNPVLGYSYAKENEKIEELLYLNKEKFDEIQSIILEEKHENQRLLKDLQDMQNIKTSDAGVDVLIISENNDKDYDNKLNSYQKSLYDAAIGLFNKDPEVDQLKSDGQALLNRVNNGISDFANHLNKSTPYINNTPLERNKLLAQVTEKVVKVQNDIKNPTYGPKLLALESTSNPDMSNVVFNPELSCTPGDGTSYNYEGIYVVEDYNGKNISYFLFDYIDRLIGDEKIVTRDIDGDDDEDVLYMSGDEIYIKENKLQKKSLKEFYSGSPIIVKSSKNDYIKGDFIQSVDNFEELVSDNSFINIDFYPNAYENNYKVEFFEIVDKFDHKINPSLDYNPEQIKKYDVDSFSNIEVITKASEDKEKIIRNNLGYIGSISSNLTGATLEAPELINLNENMTKGNNNEVVVNKNKKIFTGNSNSKITFYKFSDSKKEKMTLSIKKHSNIEFKYDIVIIGITGNLYIDSTRIEKIQGNDIINRYSDRPLLPGFKLSFNKEESNSKNPYINVVYYDGSKSNINFVENNYFEIYDLGNSAYGRSNSIRTTIENDFYYARIRAFSDKGISAYGSQILLSPQKESDDIAPEIGNISKIRIPVYKQEDINLSKFIFEDSGLKNIKDIWLDLDPEKNRKVGENRDINLQESKTGYKITKDGEDINLILGAFDSLFKKDIYLYVEDLNGNIGSRKISFEIYAPTPNIKQVGDDTISGRLNESINDEPISIYRLRNNELERLLTDHGDKTTNTYGGGLFDFKTKIIKSGLDRDEISISLRENNNTIELFKVNEKTGKITISNVNKTAHNLGVKILESNNSDNDVIYPKIQVLMGNKVIYEEFLITSNRGQIYKTDDFVNIINSNSSNKIGIYYADGNISNYKLQILPLNLENGGGDGFVYDENNPTLGQIFNIFKDGRVEILQEGYYIEYDSYDKYVIYKLRKAGNPNIIGNILIIPEENYIVR